LRSYFPAGRGLPTRSTAVFRRDGDQWMLRHIHFAVAALDDGATQRIDEWMRQLGQTAA
jgi:hypothetical protein